MSNDWWITRSAEAERDVASLTLRCWDQTGPRLAARLVPIAHVGPINARPPSVPGFGPSPVVLDVALDVDGGTVRLDRDLVEAWEVGPDQIWRTVTTNLARLSCPAVIVVEQGHIELAIVAGGAWTTGLLLRPDRLGPGFVGPLIGVAPNDATLVVGRSSPSAGSSAAPIDEVAGRVMALAGQLAEIDCEPGLPLAPLLIQPLGSFPDRWILE